MRSKPLEEEYKKAAEIEKKLTAYDFDGCRAVLIKDSDSILIRRSAFYQIHGDWLYLFSEHYDTQVFHLSDIYFYAQFDLEFPKLD